MRAGRLTIAIPTLNRVDLLKRSLESALAQTSDEVEILVSDNGSTDTTAQFLASYHDPRLRVIRHAVTVPRAQHGTLIFAEITTEFVLVLSDDDWIEPEFAEQVLALFQRHPELSFVYTGCFEHYDDVVLPAVVGPEVESSFAFIAAQAANRRQVSWCACVTRVADLRRFGPQPDERIMGDMFFWTKIAFLGPVGCVAQPLAHYVVLRPQGDNESRATPIIAWAEDTKKLHDEIIANVKRYGGQADYLAALRVDINRYMWGTVANQFIWARLSGMAPWQCVESLPYCFKLKGWRLLNLLPMLAALLFPKKLVRALVLKRARRLSAYRMRVT
ncbi:MAG: glycosyltransferase family A protein [Acidocella sp.]|nr:glycosyltransferase family A protein [Acidocella sp.]